MAPIAANAQQQQPPRGPDIAKMASQLNVSEKALQTCMPAPAKGKNAERSEPPARPDAVKITNCLKAGGAKLSQERVNEVLEASAPQGRPKG